MKSISTFVIAAGLALSCLPAGNLQSQSARIGEREQTPPVVTLRIGGRRAVGTGELRVTPDAAASVQTRTAHLTLLSEDRQRVEVRGLGTLMKTATSRTLRLRYQQRIEPDGRRVFLALLPPSDQEPAVLVHLDWGAGRLIRKEILPGLFLVQRDEPGSHPDVAGAAARRTWLSVEVQGLETALTLEGGETRTITHRGASYRLHVYRSLRRDPGTNPQLPFEGERYLLSATLTPL
jgi:hypothetical protein